ncbi:probable transmembrane protein [Photobacterium aphoticum]|uniref:Probable transmembrane protein n=1 Tax=Photobacterium aphoticum TaxID=754436 RepID=A0A090QHQ3_9GAMM|nr:probable transmembrane protein [Photobacterium aphoticum]
MTDGNTDAGDTTGPSAPGNVIVPDDTDFAEQMLNAVNQARAQEQNCGGEIMPAVPALTWDYDLQEAAFRHSSDMANGGFMSHTGSDNSTLISVLPIPVTLPMHGARTWLRVRKIFPL